MQPAHLVIRTNHLDVALHEQPVRRTMRHLLVFSPSTGNRYRLVVWPPNPEMWLMGPLLTAGCGAVSATCTVEEDLTVVKRDHSGTRSSGRH